MATSRLITPPDALITSTRGGTYAATYRVEDSGTPIVAGLAAIILGQASGPDAIPVYGSVFNLSITGTPVADFGSFLLDMRARPVGEAFPEPGVKADAWDVDVTWRAPDQGEYPGEAGVPALSRLPRVWVDFESRPKKVTRARNVQALRPGSPNTTGRLKPRNANTLGQIEDGAGVPQDSQFVEGVSPVLVIQQNVLSYTSAVALNIAFENTTNSASWYGVPAKQARFLRSETGQQLYDGTSGTLYYERQTRIEFLSNPQYLRIPNIGYERVVTGTTWRSEHVRDADGLPSSQPVTLNYNGVEDIDQWDIEYDYLTAVSYAGIA